MNLKLSISFRILLGAPSLLRAFTASHNIYFVLCSFVSCLLRFLAFLFFRFVSLRFVLLCFISVLYFVYVFIFLFSFGFYFCFFPVSLRFIHSFPSGILFTFVSCFFAAFSCYRFCLQPSLFGFDLFLLFYVGLLLFLVFLLLISFVLPSFFRFRFVVSIFLAPSF